MTQFLTTVSPENAYHIAFQKLKTFDQRVAELQDAVQAAYDAILSQKKDMDPERYAAYFAREVVPVVHKNRRLIEAGIARVHAAIACSDIAPPERRSVFREIAVNSHAHCRENVRDAAAFAQSAERKSLRLRECALTLAFSNLMPFAEERSASGIMAHHLTLLADDSTPFALKALAIADASEAALSEARFAI
jgi:hypothetical protein